MLESQVYSITDVHQKEIKYLKDCIDSLQLKIKHLTFMTISLTILIVILFLIIVFKI